MTSMSAPTPTRISETRDTSTDSVSKRAVQSPHEAAASGAFDHRKRRSVDEYSQVMRALAPSTNPLNAFAAKPIRTHFATQEEGEQLILLLRRHPVTQVSWMIIALVAAFIPVFFNPGEFFSFLPAGYGFAINFIWYAAILVFIFQSFLSWYYNVFIVTDERVVDVDFISMLYRNISSAKLNSIEDVTATSSGALHTIFDYGTVTIQTAGAKPEIEFEDVPHPNTIVELFNELLAEEELETIEGRVH